MRLFFAIATPQPIKEELAKLQTELADRLSALSPRPHFKLERLHNSHCTLRFLGNVENSRVPSVIEGVHREFEHEKPRVFEIGLTSCGTFTSRGKARVVWAGLSPQAELLTIRNCIDRGLRHTAIPVSDDNDFHPHLTLVRFREPSRLPEDFELPPVLGISSQRVEECLLIESKTLSTGPVHTVLALFLLHA